MSLLVSFTIKKIKNLDRPYATAAAVTISFLLLLLQDHPNLSLINAWGYNTMADTHFCNDIRYFYDFKPSISTATAKNTRAEIHKYNNINLAIKVGK